MKNIFVIFLLFFQFNVNAQTTFNDELGFLFHLMENRLIDDAQLYGNKLLLNDKYNVSQRDTINYFMAKMLMSNDVDTLSIPYLNNVSINSKFYYYSRFNEVRVYLKQRNVDTAFARISLIDSSTSDVINQLLLFEKAGMYLYKNQQSKFDSLSVMFKNVEPTLADEQKNMFQYAKVSRGIKRKSPVIAGLLSAFVPGLGKVYVGNNGQAIASFLSVGVIGGIAIENYLKQGLWHPQTIAFGLMTSIFYVGNIWGSALSVQVVRNERRNENKNNILVSLRMPLYKYFK